MGQAEELKEDSIVEINKFYVRFDGVFLNESIARKLIIPIIDGEPSATTKVLTKEEVQELADIKNKLKNFHEKIQKRFLEC